MKKITKRITAVVLALTLVLMSAISTFAATSNSFILDTDGERIPIPEAYTVTRTIKNMGDAGFLNKPEDIFYSDFTQHLYVADTQNNRVLRMTKSGDVDLVVDEANGSLSQPKGVYVDDENGDIWIADTMNQRIVIVDKNGKYKKEFHKPDSDVLGADFTFDIEKIYVNDMNNIFALKGANIMKMNSKGEFLNYMGAMPVGFSLTRFLIRTFGTKEQIKSTEQLEPTAYNNFLIASDGNTYGVLSEGTSGQIRRLNSVGSNTYPEQAYGFNVFKQGEYTPTLPTFNDIAVDHDGIITVLDRNTGLVYQYDKEGNLLATFGGIGNRDGVFTTPLSLAVDENGVLYILDYGTNNIQVFSPTGFIQLVHTAINQQADGKYEEAKSYWQEVLGIDSNYSLAHKGIGKILYKEGDYKQSMEHYTAANDTEGYSTSFSEYRHDFLRDYFFIIVVIILAVLIAWVYGYRKLKKNVDRWSFNIEMRGDMDK